MEESLKPLIKSMEIVGLITYKDKRCCNAFAFVTIIFCVMIRTVGLLMSAYNNNNISRAIVMTAVAVRYVLSVICSYRFRFYSQELLRLMRECWSLPNHNGGMEIINCKSVPVKVITAWFANICIFVNYILFNYIYQKKTPISELIADLNLPFYFDIFVEVCIEFITTFLFYLPTSLILIYYSALCNNITTNFNILCASIDGVQNSSTDRLLSIVQRYLLLVDIVKVLDRVYSSIIFICNVNLVFTLIFNVNYVVSSIKILPLLIINLVIIISTLFFFANACLSASKVNEASLKVPSVILLRTRFSLNSPFMDKLFYFYVQSMLEPPHLSALNIFRVNVSLLLNTFGIVVSYLFVTYQLTNS